MARKTNRKYVTTSDGWVLLDKRKPLRSVSQRNVMEYVTYLIEKYTEFNERRERGEKEVVIPGRDLAYYVKDYAYVYDIHYKEFVSFCRAVGKININDKEEDWI